MTEWFDKRVGGVSVSKEDPSMLLVGDQTPDWVRLPPELGGERLRVLGAFNDRCPKCRGGGAVRHLACQDGYGVAECPTCEFVWYSVKSEAP